MEDLVLSFCEYVYYSVYILVSIYNCFVSLWVWDTHGFWETRTHTWGKPVPLLRVWVFRGTGTGFPGKPQGSPWQSLPILLNLSMTYWKRPEVWMDRWFPKSIWQTKKVIHRRTGYVCSLADRLPESEIGLVLARHNRAAVVRRFCEFARTSFDH